MLSPTLFSTEEQAKMIIAGMLPFLRMVLKTLKQKLEYLPKPAPSKALSNLQSSTDVEEWSDRKPESPSGMCCLQIEIAFET